MLPHVSRAFAFLSAPVYVIMAHVPLHPDGPRQPEPLEVALQPVLLVGAVPGELHPHDVADIAHAVLLVHVVPPVEAEKVAVVVDGVLEAECQGRSV